MSSKMATKSSQKRFCVMHGGDANPKAMYCNNSRLLDLPKAAKVKLNLQELVVYTVPPESHQCYVVLSDTIQQSPQNMFGPFCIKHDKAIEEVYSCSISADKNHVMLSVCLSSKASQTKSNDFCIAIFATHSKIGIQRMVVQPGTFSVGTFHPSTNDAFYIVSYDYGGLPVIQSKSLNSRDQVEKPLDIADPDCENLLTISSSQDFLILQVIEADMTPPYGTCHLYLLSHDTLGIVKKITTPANVAPCHTSCTMNYLPDHSFQEGYIRLTFPKAMQTTLRQSKATVKYNALAPVQLPAVQVHSLKRLARNTIRFHLNCDSCARELHLPDVLQSYLK